MPLPGLDELLVNPARLAILAVLAPTQHAEFSAVRDAARLSDSVLSKQATTLAEHGYLDIRKGHVGKRPRTWFSITATGRQALTTHIAALQAIAALAGPNDVSVTLPTKRDNPPVRRSGSPGSPSAS